MNKNVNHFDDDGYNALFYAVANNLLDVVQSLLARKADIRACNSRGEHVILIAAHSLYHFEILQFLLNHLKSTITAEELSAFLNKDIEEVGHTILYHIVNNRQCLWEKITNKKFASRTSEKNIIDIILAHGASLFRRSVDPQTRQQQVALSYVATPEIIDGSLPLPFNIPILSYLSSLAANHLLQSKSLPLKFYHVVRHLQQHKLNNNLPLYLIEHNLKNLIGYKNAVLSCAHNKAEHFPELNCLAKAIGNSIDNTIAILPKIIDDLTPDGHPLKINELHFVVKTLLSLPPCTFKSSLCAATAKKLHSKKILLKHAKALYVAVDAKAHPSVTGFIADCDTFIAKAAIDYPEPQLPSMEYQRISSSMLCQVVLMFGLVATKELVSNKVISLDRDLTKKQHPIEMTKSKEIFKYILEETCEVFTKHPLPNKINYNLLARLIEYIKKSILISADEAKPYVQRLTDLLNSLTPLQKVIQIERANTLCESMRFFHELLAIVNQSPNIMQDRIKNATLNQLNKIILCLLLTRNPQDQIRHYLGICLNAITNNTPKKLLILSHIFTYFKKDIAQPEQVKAIFMKAFTQLAGIEYRENDSLKSLIVEYPKIFLLAALKIRLELVKLLTSDYQKFEMDILNLGNSDNNALFLSNRTIMQDIRQIEQQHLSFYNLSISTFYLDQIQKACIVSLAAETGDRPNKRIAAEQTAPRVSY